MREIRKLLVANRGEIAIRVMRAATELGIRTVGIFSEEDKFSLHRYKADEAYLTGRGLGPVRAYLDIEGIVELAVEKGVDAIHPGYGFLAENAEFAQACSDAGIIFVGPPVAAIRSMGDKVRARRAAQRVKLPLIEGTPHAVTLKEALKVASRIGYPVMLKSAFGGGGRGMRIVHDPKNLKHLYLEAQREAATAFGRPEIFIEKYVSRPKHIEVQILADSAGNVVHCYERDCSIQRRHQKVVEIAPAVTLEGDLEPVRKEICSAAVKVAKSIGYQNAGTVEFLLEPDTGNFYFMEMNTRIQVEHTVTEMVTGLDLVKAQIRIAEGHPLSHPDIGIESQQGINCHGVAIQCRITTEDPSNDFVPDYGRLTVYRSASGHGIRLDAGSAHGGAVVTPYYDSLLVKVSSWGKNLGEAARRMDRALAEFRVRGVKTNISFLRNIVKEPSFLRGDCRTDYLEKHPELMEVTPPRDRASKLISFVGEVIVNKNPVVKGYRPEKVCYPSVPSCAARDIQPGTKQILDEKGADGLIDWVRNQKRLLVTDTTFRDAHQSLLATRMRTFDMLKVAEGMARSFPEMFSYEMWGGATFDASMRFLKESPWDRLVRMREAIPNTLLQMLLRGSNAVGYTNYPDNVIREFVKLASEAGIDLFRIFDSLNWLPAMRVAIDSVRSAGKIAEVAICYTGNIEDESRKKYNLKYYVNLARAIEKAGAHILAIKDMAGLLRPYSAKILVRALKEEVGIPIHLHTHDTSGGQLATLAFSAEENVDIVDAALASMSGLTSQPNLNTLVAQFEYDKRATGLERRLLDEYSEYWEQVRRNYRCFESDLRSGTATVYDHEMPGGQYTNLRAQAESLGLGDRWKEVVEAYRAANDLFGDIVKVTPSSKVVGDMALFMVNNGITRDNFFEKADTLSFPKSVVDMMTGYLGKTPGGFPKRVRDAILKGKKPLSARPGKLLPKADLEATLARLKKQFPLSKSGFSPGRFEVISSIMYPDVTIDFLKHLSEFGDTSIIPTPAFFYGLNPGEEIEIELEEGKTLYLKYIGKSEPDPEGMRTVFFELNGYPRDIQVYDRSLGTERVTRTKADPENMHHIGSTLPGRVVHVEVKPGDAVEKGDTLLTLEAMKMESTVTAPFKGVVGEILVSKGDIIESGDLLVVFK